MDKPWQVVKALETHNLRTNKEQIIEAQVQAQNTEFFEGCRLALDAMVTFGVKQVSEKDKDEGQEDEEEEEQEDDKEEGQ